MTKAPLIGIERLRLGSDGHGITTLVAFHGCPLRCLYCLNPQCHSAQYKERTMTPEEVMAILRKDELYYIATKGGVTFGGGEPLLHSQFIKEILYLGASEWNVTIETSLNVDRKALETLTPYLDYYLIDIKEINSNIYKRYTGRDNGTVLSNLQYLIDLGLAEKIKCRVPLIPDFNDSDSQKQSLEILTKMGIKNIEIFTYQKDIAYERKRKMRVLA